MRNKMMMIKEMDQEEEKKRRRWEMLEKEIKVRMMNGKDFDLSSFYTELVVVNL